MYKIKQIPEDFIVKEINDIELSSNGDYSYFLLKKRNYNTLRAVKIISEKLKIPEKNIGFAGNKDKHAVTEQIISIKNGNRNIENIALKDIELKFIGKGNREVFLGSHKGNEFTITMRNLANKETANINKKIKNNEILMPNFFGPQRFSNNNAEIGKAIIKKGFKKAVELIIEANSDFKNEIIEHLEKRPNDFVVALKIIPLKLLKLYVHSYQSFLFNKTLEQYAKKNSKLKDDVNKKLPLIGFGTELGNNEMSGMIKKIMEEEKINFRDFIIRQIPELSSEGIEREAFIKINDFK
ncbi:tRNA pseudouridine(13) synthase TruD, partial [Candidatus Woesearchaeota archaeon]|nr:tRNA pseudouridine(13) synthase TruD [Candidatus Woesearchaeota archaeon]